MYTQQLVIKPAFCRHAGIAFRTLLLLKRTAHKQHDLHAISCLHKIGQNPCVLIWLPDTLAPWSHAFDPLRANAQICISQTLKDGGNSTGLVKIYGRVTLGISSTASKHLVAQEAVVDEDAVQAIPQDAVHQRSGDGAVHAAGQRADDVLLWAHLHILNTKGGRFLVQIAAAKQASR